MNWKKLSILFTLVFALSIFLAACGGGSDDTEQDSGDDATTESEGDNTGGELAEEQVLNINIKTEPPSLHPGTSSDTTSSAVLDQVFEGLTRVNQEGEPEPAMAEDIDVSDDGRSEEHTSELQSRGQLVCRL